MDVAAVDLGASSGRVMLAHVDPDRLQLEEIHRFANVPVAAGKRLHWDIHALYSGVLEGLRSAVTAAPELAGAGIDSWAVDYGLLDVAGQLITDPAHYRDARTDGVVERIHRDVSASELYAVTGLQQQPFNTLVQLASERGSAALQAARTLLLVPDLLTYWLTGSIGAERTNASTTQMYDVSRREWAPSLLTRLGLPAEVLPPLRDPGSIVGPLSPEVRAVVGAPDTLRVVAVGSHDTASAVVGVPAADRQFAYISSGTWSLVGVEVEDPVLTDDARAANFTNEGGVDGTIRLLRNVMGLWLLQESMRTWESRGHSVDLEVVLSEAAGLPALTRVVGPDHPSFLPPGDQPARINDRLRATGQALASTPAETVRTILDSLALAYRRAIRTAVELSGVDVRVVHIVGGGARNALLCQLTADACGLPVVAGPVEAAAIGNALVQARALGVVEGDLTALRALIRATQPVVRYAPTVDEAPWAAAESRIG